MTCAVHVEGQESQAHCSSCWLTKQADQSHGYQVDKHTLRPGAWNSLDLQPVWHSILTSVTIKRPDSFTRHAE